MDPSGLHSGREPPVSQRPITYGKDIARVTGKDFYRRPKRLLRKLKFGYQSRTDANLAGILLCLTVNVTVPM